jgi:antagonist of KipI
MSLTIVKPGILDTLQDGGRTGYGKWGINPGGVMDRYAFSVANALVGNSPDAGVIECHYPALQIQFDDDVLISLTGADFTPCIGDEAIPVWKPVWVKRGSVLSFRKNRNGCRCYLAVHGGFPVSPWLNSVSTHLTLQLGGFEGRVLKKGDRVPVIPGHFPVPVFSGNCLVMPWRVNVSNAYPAGALRFIHGHEWNWLTATSQKLFTTQTFTVLPASDRMACHLKHEPLTFVHQEELLSSAVTMGTLQALPSGKVIILMADHQTTGGYPRIGHVCAADLPRLAQAAAHQSICFAEVTVAAAEKMLISLREEIHTIEKGCLSNLQRYYAEH